MPIPDPLPVVTLAVGRQYSDVYVHRLYSMLARYAPERFELACLTDRRRHLPTPVRSIDCSRSGLHRPSMRKTTYKLGIFDPGLVPYPEFLYLDLTVVIQKNLTGMLEHGFNAPHDLIVVRDWNREIFNASIMRVRQCAELARIPELFRGGASFASRNHGDQEFTDGYLRSNRLQSRVGFWRPEDVVSYKNARWLNRTDPPAAAQYLESGTIVKFFGKDRMHQLANPWYRALRMRWRRPHGRQDAGFWIDELVRRWR